MIRVFAPLAFLMMALALTRPAAATEITEIRVVGGGEYTQIALAADGPIEHEAFFISDENGRTVDLALPNAFVGADADTPLPTGAVDAYEITDGEILFRLSQPMMVSRALPIGPTTSDPRHRLVVDLVRVAPVRFDRAAEDDVARRLEFLSDAAPPSAARDLDVESPKAAGNDQYVVVIDPGHGGHDPGASSRNKTREKDIVLKTSLLLKQELERAGRYKVFLTREDDTYIDHEDRVTMARNWGADLFISVHADAAGNSSVSGATVYTLSARGERRVEGTARTNGWDLPIEDGTTQEVSGILADLIKRETKSNSSIFAELLIPELAKAGPIVRNSHRQENFFVLLAPDVPAALVEIGFLTNTSDVQRLSSEEGRLKTASAIARGIDAYFARRDVFFAAN